MLHIASQMKQFSCRYIGFIYMKTYGAPIKYFQWCFGTLEFQGEKRISQVFLCANCVVLLWILWFGLKWFSDRFMLRYLALIPWFYIHTASDRHTHTNAIKRDIRTPTALLTTESRLKPKITNSKVSFWIFYRPLVCIVDRFFFSL